MHPKTKAINTGIIIASSITAAPLEIRRKPLDFLFLFGSCAIAKVVSYPVLNVIESLIGYGLVSMKSKA